MHKTTQGTNEPTNRENITNGQKEKTAILERLKKMAMYDAKDYLTIEKEEDGLLIIRLNTDSDIPWDIVESLEFNENKVKIKFPDRSKAIEKYNQALSEEVIDDEPLTVSAHFLGEKDE